MKAVGTPAAYQRVRISPDGRSAAVDIDSASSNVWILDLVRSTMTRLTVEWNNAGAAWTPDGSHVVFTSARAGERQLFWQALDSRTAEPLTTATSGSPSDFTRSSWSPGGRILAYDRLDPQTGWDIWALAADEGREVRPFLVSSFNERCPTFSPDGRSIAYESDETGRFEIYVQPFPGPGGRTRISTDSGINPVWWRDGRELFYWGPDNASMMRVEMSPSPKVAPQRPRLLFREQSSYPFDVDPQGRFLIIQDQPEEPLSPIVAVLNWFEELRARVPVR